MINAENVSYTYMKGGPFETAAIHDISLKIEDGEFVGIIGHTGSGKSTLIQILSGLLKPELGTVCVNNNIFYDKNTNMRQARFDIGLVMQYPEHQLFEETVYEDIAFGPRNKGYSKEKVDELVHYAADLVGLDGEVLKKSPFDLSGGQKRRVAIAGIIAMIPKILILDEPAAGLDPRGRDDILKKIKKLHKETNITVIFVSHSMEDIAKLAERVIVLEHGSIKYDCNISEVFNYSTELEKIGLSVPQVTKICNKLKDKGMPVSNGIFTIDEALSEIKKLLNNLSE